MHPFIDKVSPILEKEFTQKWFNDIKTNSPIETTTGKIDSKILQIAYKIFNALNLSLLSGEYIKDEETFQKQLEVIKKQLDKVNQRIAEFPPTSELYQIQQIFLDNLLTPLKNAILHYEGFQKNILKKYTDPNKIPLFKSFSDKFQRSTNTITIKAVKEEYLAFIEFNLKIAQIDHHLSVEKDQLIQLIRFHHILKEKINVKSNNTILKILKNKNDFLLEKILRRYDRDPENFYYAFNFENNDLNPDSLKPGFYKFFKDQLLLQYKITKDKDHRFFLRELINKRIENLNYSDFHALIRAKKDTSNASLEELNSIYKDFQEKEIMETSSYNNWSFKASKCFLYHNILSFKLNNPELSISELESELKSIDALQQETEVRNYFPYKKICDHILCRLDKQRSLDNNFPIHEFLNLLSKSEKKLYQSFEWCKEKHFLPFQLIDKESTTTVEIENFGSVSLFMASSFLLPVNYNQIEREIRNISNDLQKHHTLLEIKTPLKEDQRKITEIREQMEKEDQKHIQILGIFAAIVLFTSSNIQIFSNVKNFNDALGFMLVFAYIMVLFIMVIWLITRDKTKKISIIHWLSLSLMIIATIYFMFHFTPTISPSLKKNPKTGNKKFPIIHKKNPPMPIYYFFKSSNTHQ